MPPKGKPAKDDKKAKDDGPDPKQVIGAFNKDYAAQCSALQIDPLVLYSGDYSAPFAKICVHPQLAVNNALSPLHAKALAGALCSYAHLQTLCLWTANLQDEGAAALASWLATNRTVTSVEMTDCGVGALGCKALADALERNMTLTRLCLECNPIGSAGVEALGGLRFNRALGQLELGYCGLTEKDGALLAGGLMRCATLKTLELRSNALMMEGVLAVLAQIRAGARLFRIGLADTGIGREPEVRAALLDVLATVTTCCEYDLLGNALGDAFAYELLKLARAHGHIIDLRVCATSAVDPMLYKQLLDVCASNKKEWIKANKKKGGKKGKKKK